jgi:hypothetical protein
VNARSSERADVTAGTRRCPVSISAARADLLGRRNWADLLFRVGAVRALAVVATDGMAERTWCRLELVRGGAVAAIALKAAIASSRPSDRWRERQWSLVADVPSDVTIAPRLRRRAHAGGLQPHGRPLAQGRTGALGLVADGLPWTIDAWGVRVRVDAGPPSV